MDGSGSARSHVFSARLAEEKPHGLSRCNGHSSEILRICNRYVYSMSVHVYVNICEWKCLLEYVFSARLAIEDRYLCVLYVTRVM